MLAMYERKVREWMLQAGQIVKLNKQVSRNMQT